MALHTSTIISRKLSDILTHVSRVALAFPTHVPLFTLSTSPTLPQNHLQDLTTHLSSISPQAIGCLSALPSSSSDASQTSVACSLAMFHKDHAAVFRSEIPGRNSPQVGRWHAFRKRDNQSGFGTGDAVQANTETVSWEDIWAKNVDVPPLPFELRELSADDAHTIIYLSDGSPEGLSNSLQSLPAATKVGLIASSTPFITGRPYTLFHGRSIYSSGAVGLCLHSSSRSELRVAFPGLRALTPEMIVTESEGNLVLSLDDKNPSRILLAAIEKGHNFSPTDDQSAKLLRVMKDDEFFLGVLDAHTRERKEPEICQVYRITSGDPSRGSLALESEAAPSLGARVQIYRAPANANPNILSRYKLSSDKSTRRTVFAVAPPDLDITNASMDSAETIVLENTFLAASENGFIIDRYVPNGKAGERPWTCKVPGGLAELQLGSK